MELLKFDPISVFEFLPLTIAGFLLILILQRLSNASQNLMLSSGRTIPIRTVLNKIQVFSEPIIVIFLIGKALTMDPIYESIVLIALIAAGFRFLRDYVAGRFVLYGDQIYKGEIIRLKDFEGRITKKTRLGIYVKAEEGMRYVRYSSLLKNGYSMPASEPENLFCSFRLKPFEASQMKHPETRIFDLLVSLPYLERSFKPEMSPKKEDNSMDVKVLLLEKVKPESVQLFFEEHKFECTLN